MSDLAIAVFRRYGLRAVGLVLLATVAIWLLAHTAAAPGSNVSVLWGLAQYTQASPDGPTKPEERRVRDAPSSVAAPIGIERGDHNSPDQAIVALRVRRNLRELTAMESDRALASLPRGTFGFLYAETFRMWLSIGQDSSDYAGLKRFPGRGSHFEVHRSEDGDVSLVGFASEPDAARVSSGTPAPPANVTIISVSPEVAGPMTSVISVPFTRIANAIAREVELEESVRVFVLDLQLKSVAGYFDPQVPVLAASSSRAAALRSPSMTMLYR